MFFLLLLLFILRESFGLLASSFAGGGPARLVVLLGNHGRVWAGSYLALIHIFVAPVVHFLPLVAPLLLGSVLALEVLHRCRFYTLETEDFTRRYITLPHLISSREIGSRWRDLHSFVLEALLTFCKLSLREISPLFNFKLRRASQEIRENRLACVPYFDFLRKPLLQGVRGNVKRKLPFRVTIAQEVYYLRHVVL